MTKNALSPNLVTLTLQPLTVSWLAGAELTSSIPGPGNRTGKFPCSDVFCLTSSVCFSVEKIMALITPAAVVTLP